MKTNKDQIYDFLKLHASAQESGGVTTQYLAETLGILRTNVSSILNTLVAEGKVSKTNGRPVLYRITNQDEVRENRCFDNLAGANGSLLRQVQLAKAAVIYPEKSLNTLITGQPGAGKSFFAMLMHRYAVAAGVIPEDAPFIVFDCKDHQGDENSLMAALFGADGTGGVFHTTGQGVLHIDNAHLLSTGLRNRFCSAVEQVQHRDGEPLTKPSPMVIVACDNSNKAACDDYAKKLPIVIELPGLAERPIEERMALIQNFFTLEAARAKKTLVISAELLRCLLLYDCSYNIKQLKGDIKRGCAMAYLREHGSKNNSLDIYVSDFAPYVRKGFLNYRDHRDEVERIIPADYSYAFSESTMQMSAIDRAKLKSASLYDEIDRKAGALLERGMTRDEISILLSAEFEAVFRQYWIEASRQVVNKEQLANLVDNRVIELVEVFLDEVTARLLITIPPSVFYSLCLHIDSVVKGNTGRQLLSNHQMSEIVEQHKAKYSLALQFAARIEKAFSIALPVDEVVLITMFLCFENPMVDIAQTPVILFALHGSGVAASLAGMANQLVKSDNTFWFEIPFDDQPSAIYQALSDCIRRIDRGKGVIALYDMEFMSAFFDTIAAETGIAIRTVNFPVPQITIEWARRASVATDLDSLYQNMMTNLDMYRKPFGRVIVTLCTTGEGGAQELKKYLEQYGDLRGMEVVPSSMADRDRLREKLMELQKHAMIHCIVGVQDPKLLGIPFISISEVLGSEPAALPEILRFKNREKSRIDFDEMFRYLGEQLEHVDIKKLRRVLPPVIEQIDSEVSRMSLDSEIGLLMHMACCINRLAAKEAVPQNLHREQILREHSASYKKLLRIVKPLERAFGVIFPDDEMANVIMIIKKL